MRTREEVFSQIQKSADALRAGTTMTNAAAVVEAIKANPALYEEYRVAPDGPVAPQEPARKRQTVADFVYSIIEKRADELEKSGVNGVDAIAKATNEHYDLYQISCDPRHARRYMDEVAPARTTPIVQKTAVQKVAAPVVKPVATSTKTVPVDVKKATPRKALTFNEVYYGGK